MSKLLILIEEETLITEEIPEHQTQLLPPNDLAITTIDNNNSKLYFCTSPSKQTKEDYDLSVYIAQDGADISSLTARHRETQSFLFHNIEPEGLNILARNFISPILKVSPHMRSMTRTVHVQEYGEHKKESIDTAYSAVKYLEEEYR